MDQWPITSDKERSMKAIRIHEHGGPEVLKLEEIPVPQPGEGQALVKVAASGVNFVDIYQRTGFNQVSLPFTAGNEGAGVVESVGPGVAHVCPGDHVAWEGTLGSYAEYAVVPAWRLV